MSKITPLLDLVVEKNASDLHLAVGRPPTIRRHGKLVNVKGKPLTPEETEALLSEIIPDRCRRELEEVGTTDFAHAHLDKGRFRVSAFHQKHHTGVALRLIPSTSLLVPDRSATLHPERGVQQEFLDGSRTLLDVDIPTLLLTNVNGETGRFSLSEVDGALELRANGRIGKTEYVLLV